MATYKKVVKTTGNKKVTKVKDTSKLTGRQQKKTALSKNATAVSIAGEATATATNAVNQHYKTERQKSSDRNKTYQKAIDQWNGILKSTPDNAEGTNPGLEGSSANNSNTGTNPGEGLIGW